MTITIGAFRSGFALGDVLRLYTAADLAGTQTADKSARRLPARRRNQIDPLELARMLAAGEVNHSE